MKIRTPGLAFVGLLLLASAAPGLERPAEIFFREPFLTHVEISPDGEHLAALVSRGDKETLIVRTTAGSAPIPVGRHEERDTSISQVRWVNPERLIFALETRWYGGTGIRPRSTRLLAVNKDGSDQRYLGKKWPGGNYTQFQTGFISLLRDDPGHVLINHGGPREMDVEMGYLSTKRATHPKIGRWWADRFGKVRAGLAGRHRFTDLKLFARSGPTGKFKLISEFDPYEGEPGLYFGAFGDSPEQIYVIAHDPKGRSSVREYDIDAMQLGAEVFAHPVVDVWYIERNFEERAVAVAYIVDRPELHFLDEAAAREQRGIDSAMQGTVNRIVSVSWDGKKKVIRSSSPTSPPHYSLLDVEAKKISSLFGAYPELENVPLAPMKAFSYLARDGLSIHAYLTTPRFAKGPYPMIVLVHGANGNGPESRDYLQFDSTVQFLANRGFAVFQANYRGSWGYGTEFLEAGRSEWGLKIQDDLEDGLRFLIADGSADPNRIGIFGHGFGGYTALMGAVRTPNLYAAAAGYGAPTDLPTLLRDDQNYWGGSAHDKKRIGSTWGDRERLGKTSPYHQIDKIVVPILLGHGELDSQVHVKHAERMHSALEKAGKQSELHLYKTEHELMTKDYNRIDFYEKLGAFFQRHLAAPEVTP